MSFCYNSTALNPEVYIIPQPPDLKVDQGKRADLTCSATGVGASEFVYYWFLNREPVGQNSAILTIDPVSVDDTGNYTCYVESPYKAVGESKPATLILNGNCIHICSFHLSQILLHRSIL